MRLFYFLLIVGCYAISNAQITGVVTDTQGNTLPFVNVYVENTNIGTTTNGDGLYTLDHRELISTGNSQKKGTVVFQYLGFTTLKKELDIKATVITLDVSLREGRTSLDEVVVTAGVNPADAIVKAAIAKRKENLKKNASYTARFYSKGLWKVKNAPEKIFGQEVGDLGGGLDSTRTGIIYLSETISNISYQRPNNFSETIIASKISGDDNGFSFNTAIDANFSFYENTIDLNVQMLSPIASNAFANYRYHLEGTFIEDGKLINKITVSPRRPNDKVFTGTVYIVEDDWELYGVDLYVDGKVIQVPVVGGVNFKQNFKYDTTQGHWVKISQVIDFSFGLLKFKGEGRFIASYSDYNFEPNFTKSSFTKKVLSFEDEANKKDSLFWEKQRPVALTRLEQEDYIRKDSIQLMRKSEKYLDSLDTKSNAINLFSPITGYRYRDTFKRYSFSYDGVLSTIQYNTVQGWYGSTGINYSNWSADEQKTFYAFAKANYGFSDDRLRYSIGFSRRFNRKSNSRLSIIGGVGTKQFNDEDPISTIINTIASLGFERNFLKIYERSFAEVFYSQELFNGLKVFTTAAYEDRKPLFNTTDQTFFPRDEVVFTSNNPLNPLDTQVGAFDTHSIVKAQFTTQINFGQKYYDYPDSKINISSDRFPTVFLTYETGFAASQNAYNFNQLRLRLRQGFSISNKGRFDYNLKAGTFLGDATGISFVDFQHFNGNQTRVNTTGSYLSTFNLLPYYERSTNNSYFEGHTEHDFNGWLLGKIPGINKLNFNLIVGGHVLSTQENTPYTEWSVGLDNIGWSKYRFLRLDYVRSSGLGNPHGALIFGLKFL